MQSLLYISLIVVYTIERADFVSPNKFKIFMNDTFDQEDFSFILREQFSVSNEKICASKCSRNVICETAVFDSLRKMCFLYSSSLDSYDFARSFQPGEVIQTYQPTYTVFYIERLKDGIIACGCSDSTVKLLDIYQNKIVKEYTGHSDDVRVIIEMSNGDLASGSLDNKVIIWDRKTGAQKLVYTNHTNYVLGLAELSNGMIVSGSYDLFLKVWNPSAGQLIYNYYKGLLVTVIKVLKSFQVAVAFRHEHMEIWNSEMSSVVATLARSGGAIYSISALSNNLMVSGFDNGMIDLWNLTSYQKITSIPAHTMSIFGLKELKNGLLVSISFDKYIKVWNINTESLINTISIHSYSIFGLEITENGYIISSGYDSSEIFNPPIKICSP